MRPPSTGWRAALIGAVVVSQALTGVVHAAGSDTHRPAAQYAARLSAEPFKDHWEACFGAMVPDQMIDQPLAHENHRAAGMLYTLEAIRYLREGSIQRGLFLASARSHYLTDSLAIAHGDVWKPRHAADVMRPGEHGEQVWSFLPKSVQGYHLPFGSRREGTHYRPLLIGAPPLQAEQWDKIKEIGLAGSMHAFFDRTGIHQGHRPGEFPLDAIPDTTNWSAYDREVVARWQAEQIALEVLDRDSVLASTGQVEFAAGPQMQAAFDHEMQNMIAAVIAYYRYLSVASNTTIEGNIDALLPATDRLVLMARHDPAIYISSKAPWPLRRACMLLAMEMVRARHRVKGDLGHGYTKGLRVACEGLIRPVEMPAGEEAKRILVAWKLGDEERIQAAAAEGTGHRIIMAKGAQHAAHILLQGDDLQSTIHLVDYLLDLTYAPLNGRAPVEVLFHVFQQEWAGVTLMNALTTTPEEQVRTLFKRVPSPHANDHAAWGDKVHWLVWPHASGTDINLSGVLPRFWNLFVLDLPFPDGTVVDLSTM